MSDMSTEKTTPDIWYSPDEQCNVLDVDVLRGWLKTERDRYPDSPRANTLDYVLRVLNANMPDAR